MFCTTLIIGKLSQSSILSFGEYRQLTFTACEGAEENVAKARHQGVAAGALDSALSLQGSCGPSNQPLGGFECSDSEVEFSRCVRVT